MGRREGKWDGEMGWGEEMGGDGWRWEGEIRSDRYRVCIAWPLVIPRCKWEMGREMEVGMGCVFGEGRRDVVGWICVMWEGRGKWDVW